VVHVERLIGSIRHECLDHVIVLNERHLKRVLREYLAYYHGYRTHQSLEMDAPNRPSHLSAIELQSAGYVRLGWNTRVERDSATTVRRCQELGRTPIALIRRRAADYNSVCR
jgi:hypothetical protein